MAALRVSERGVQSLSYCQPFAIGEFDNATPLDNLVDIFQLQQSQGRVELAHLAVCAEIEDVELADLAKFFSESMRSFKPGPAR